MICMSCTATSLAGREGHSDGERVCLAAEGFGNRTCFLQSMANKVNGGGFTRWCYLFVCPFVCQSVCSSVDWNTYTKRGFLKKTKQFKAMVSIDVVTNRKSYVSFSTDWLILGPIRWPWATANLAPCPTANRRKKLHPRVKFMLAAGAYPWLP